MERSHLAHYVWYINYSDTLAGVFFMQLIRKNGLEKGGD